MVRATLVAALLATLGTTACSRAEPARPAPAAPAPASAGASAGAPEGPCGAATPPDARVGTPRIGAARVPLIDLGAGTTAVVFLHQTDRTAMCGFLPYATWLTGRTPVRAVLFDLCGYGRATCPPDVGGDQQGQVAAAVAHARALPSVRRVVVVGASMGGALALAAGGRRDVDAVVDLSGPPDWLTADATRTAPKVRVPCLVVSSPGDSSTDFDGLRAAFGKIPAEPRRFVTGGGAHGWDLLREGETWTPVADLVRSWVEGSYR